jgi:hypothetical protein
LERQLRRGENADGDRAGYHAETEEWSAAGGIERVPAR